MLDYYITQEGNTVDSDNTTNQTFTYAVSPDVEQEPCTSVMFNVTARNGLGNSIPGTIVTGLPIGNSVTLYSISGYFQGLYISRLGSHLNFTNGYCMWTISF